MITVIDIENIVYANVRTAVLQAYSDAVVKSDWTNEMKKFPCIIVGEIGNTTNRRTQDGCAGEHRADVTYQVDVFCNDKTGAKSKAKSIMGICDSVMTGFKFTRMLMSSTPAVDDTIYRITARYTLTVSEPIVKQNGDTLYQAYRR